LFLSFLPCILISFLLYILSSFYSCLRSIFLYGYFTFLFSFPPRISKSHL
jgi:hypothetical protein